MPCACRARAERMPTTWDDRRRGAEAPRSDPAAFAGQRVATFSDESTRCGTGAVERAPAVSPCNVRFLGIRVRHLQETVTLLAARAPKVEAALSAAKQARRAFVVLDGTLISIDRLAADRPFYSGKHRKHGMNLQVIASPDGEILWVSGALPGAVHDLTAARIWGIVRRLAAAGLIVLADKGYIGAGDPVITPYRGRGKPASQKAANRAHARQRTPGERANAQLKTWHILRKLRCCPWRAGQLAKAIHVLQAHEITG